MQLSIRAYARHRGVTEGAVRNAIKTGRITKQNNGKIDPKIADRQWLKNTDPSQVKIVKKEEKSEKSNKEILSSPVGTSYQQSRAIKEIYNAKLTKLQFEKESQKLVSIDEIKTEIFNCVRMTRDRILNIPDRVIPDLVGKTNIHEMKQILKKELLKSLEELSKM